MDLNDKNIAKLVGKFEDCVYLIKKSSNEEERQFLQKQASDYLQTIYVESNELKDINTTQINPAILNFLQDIKITQKNLDSHITQEIITIDKLKSIINMVDSIKGERLYHLINHNKNTTLKYTIEYEDGTKEEKQEIKKGYFMERLAKFTGLIFSGLASDNLYELFKNEGFTEENMPFSLSDIDDISLIDKYIKKLEDVLEKNGFNLNRTTPSGQGDLELNLKNEYVAVLTSTNVNTSWQNNSCWTQLCQFDKDKSFQLIYLLKGFTNEEYKKDNTLSYITPNNEDISITPQKHGLKILQQFSFFNNENEKDKQLNFEQKLNGLPFLSIIGNEALINHEYKDKNGNYVGIADFLKINPLILGSDSYWLYKGLRECRLSDNPEEAFLNFILSYAEDLSSNLKDALPNVNLGISNQSGFHAIAENLNRLLKKLPNMFGPDIIGRQWEDEEFLKCQNIISNIKGFINKVKPEERNTATNCFLDSIRALNPQIIKIEHAEVDLNKYVKKQVATNQDEDSSYQNCINLINSNMREDSRERIMILGMLESIKSSPERLYRTTYYAELGCSDIFDSMQSNKKTNKSGIFSYATAQRVYDLLSDCDHSNKIEWFNNVADSLEEHFKLPNELNFNNLLDWLSQIKTYSGNFIAREIVNVLSNVVDESLVKVSDFGKIPAFKQIRSKILNSDYSHSNNLENITILNDLGLNPKIEGYDKNKIITKDEIHNLLVKLIENNKATISSNQKPKI